MKRIAAVLIGLGLAPAAAADEQNYVSVLGDYLAKPASNHVPELKDGIGVDARYGTLLDETWGYELRVGYGTLKVESAGADGFHSEVGANGLFRFGEFLALTPYLVGGGGLAYSDLGSETEGEPRAGLMFDLGAGAWTRPFAHVFGRGLSARAEVTGNYEHYDEHHLDVRAYLGLQLALAPPPAPAPEETVAVVPVEPTPEPAPEPVPAAAPEPVTPPAPEPVEPTIEVAKAGDTIVLRGVTFETAKALLTSNAKTILDEVAEKLNKRPELKVEVGGHTDSRGNDAYNQDLSERRAQAVVEYLTTQGVDAGRLTSQGYGETQPVDSNDTADGRERNRRVELKVID